MPEQVRQSIDKGVDYLERVEDKQDGTWPDYSTLRRQHHRALHFGAALRRRADDRSACPKSPELSALRLRLGG